MENGSGDGSDPGRFAFGAFVAMAFAMAVLTLGGAAIIVGNRKAHPDFKTIGDSAPQGRTVAVTSDNAFFHMSLRSSADAPATVSSQGECRLDAETSMNGTWTVLGRAEAGKKRLLVEIKPEEAQGCLLRVLMEPALVGAAIAWADGAPERDR